MGIEQSAVLMVFGAACALSCHSKAPSPFIERDAGAVDAEADADASPDVWVDAPADASGDADPTLGGPCVDDGQCDDGIECTFDSCDLELGRCRYAPNHKACADDSYCNGIEQCEPRLGCRAGDAVTCSDTTTCTVDRCVEETRSCEHEPRDADGDGDPVWNCPGGGDCDETNPLVSSLAAEVCGNQRDDDCDQEVDEEDCATPQYDTCFEALEISEPGRYPIDLSAAASDYSASCAGAWRDGVLAIIVPDGPARDVDVLARTKYGSLALAAVDQCGDASTETACVVGATASTGGTLAWLRLRAAPPGAHAVYLFTSGAEPIVVDVAFSSPEAAPANETCSTAKALVPGVHETVPVIDPADDLSGECDGVLGELVYELTLTEPRDVHAHAASVDGNGHPILSLRDTACADRSDELTCRSAPDASLFERLQAGTYYFAVSASAPSVLDLVVETTPLSAAPADDTCATAPSMTPGETLDVQLAWHSDSIRLGCVAGAPDAAYALELAERSDVLLVERSFRGQQSAVSLAKSTCEGPDDLVACTVSSVSPIRAQAHDVPAGSYRAVVENIATNPVSLTAYVRPAQAPRLVPFADTCADAVDVPEAGGFFQGNTSNAEADYVAGCDLGGQPAGGARDQMLRLTLSRTRRVLFDMQGSGYNTLLNVRQGPNCPGTELVHACAAGYYSERSFLDLVLTAGTYFVQVDGYAGASGEWFLDVHVADP